MPASAVARWTPAITGMFGTCFGARGETEEDIAGALMESGYADARRGGRASQRLRYSSRHRSDSEFLLLRGRRHLAVGRLGIRRLGVLCCIRRLVQPLDFGFRAQLGDVVGLGLAGDILLDLRLDLLEIRRLAAALFLDLDDVPAELRLHGVGDLARLEREGDCREFRHHLLLGEEAEVAAVGRAG